MAKSINLIIGSTRDGRISKSIADWLVLVAKQEGIDLGIYDLKEVNLPMFNDLPPAYVPTSTDEGKAWQEKVATSDAFVFLTSEYNRSIPASLKNAIDYLFAEWNGKPAHIISYGYVDGGANATKHLKDILGWAKVDVHEDNQTLALTQDMFDETGKFKDIDTVLSTLKENFIVALKSL